MKLLLLQAAAPTYEPEDHRANVPLAAASLAAVAAERLGARGLDVEVLDRDVADRAGDAALARIVAERAPDVVAATLYCWSSFRTLDVLARARRARPGMLAVVGGPEVAAGNEFLAGFAGRAFDVAASGEGEEMLVEVLAARLESRDLAGIAGLGVVDGDRGVDDLHIGAMRWSEARAPVADLATIPSPYLTRALALRRGGIAHLETARGCVFECDFCFYHADFRKVRAFPGARVAAEVRHALAAGARDLYLMDPTFNGHSGYRETLRALRPELRDAGASVHTELRAEPIDAARARELADAGITSVEVGLQSITPAALAAVGRTFERERFARGCRALLEAGIRVEIGTIVGLPGDTPEGMEATFRYARDECGAEAETVPFVLSLLPATVLRERAAQHGIAYRAFPPYAITSGAAFDGASIRATLARYGEIFDRELDAIGTVRLVEHGGTEHCETEHGALAPSDLVRRAFVNLQRAGAEELAARGRALADRVESTFAAVLRGGGDGATLVEKATAFLRPIREANPHGLLEVVLEADAPADLAATARAIRRALPPIEGHYLNEHLRYVAAEGADVSMRVVASLPVVAFETWGRRVAEEMPVVWRARVDSERQLAELLEGPFETGALLVEPAPGVSVAALARLAGDDATDLRFARSEDQRALDAAVGRAEVPRETAVVLGEHARVVSVRRGL